MESSRDTQSRLKLSPSTGPVFQAPQSHRTGPCQLPLLPTIYTGLSCPVYDLAQRGPEQLCPGCAALNVGAVLSRQQLSPLPPPPRHR